MLYDRLAEVVSHFDRLRSLSIGVSGNVNLTDAGFEALSKAILNLKSLEKFVIFLQC